jgi:sugar lactone lactonase YvrE
MALWLYGFMAALLLSGCLGNGLDGQKNLGDGASSNGASSNGGSSNGGGSGGSATPASYTINGTVSGLSGTVVLQNNSGDNLSVSSNGSFSFVTPVADGGAYSVSVHTQPAGETCSVGTGSGTVAGANITSVVVTCAVNTYAVGGSISGLGAYPVVLQNNGGDNLIVSNNGSFSFVTPVADGGAYSVSVLTQPVGETCSVGTGSGTVSGSIVTGVVITCAVNTYTVGGTISGLGTNPVVLQNNSGDNLSVSSNGSFSFVTPVADGGTYSVSVFTQPSDRSCTVTSNGSGTIASSNISNVTVTCTALLVGGTIQGTPLVLVPIVSTLPVTGVVSYVTPQGITTDGTNLYLVDSSHDTIVQIVIATGAATILAGQSGVQGAADGTGTAATFHRPDGITNDGNSLYVADLWNHKIRKITPASGPLSAMTSANAVVTSLNGAANTAGSPGAIDGVGTSAQFNYPDGITTDGINLYVTDQYNNKIRKIAPSSGTLSAMTNATAVVSSLTGLANTAVTAGHADGAGTGASFHFLFHITTDGTNLYAVDGVNGKIRKIAPSSGTLSAMTNANSVVSSLTGAQNAVVAVGAADGAAATATFNNPVSITTDGTSLYVADTFNNKIRQITPSSGTLSAMTSANAVVSSLTGAANTAVTGGAVNGAGINASFSDPWGITTDGTKLYVDDSNNNLIRIIQ